MQTRNNIIKSNGVPEVYSVTGGGAGALKCSSSREYYGDGQIVENGSLAMSRYGGGYFDSDGSPFYYFSDYQGNNISVVDNKGNVCQTTDYYPYGEVWRLDNALTLGTKNTFLYSDKEYLSMDGLHEYDFSARRQTPAVPGFNRIDPDCEKYYDINPYVFCGSNPVMNIDPTGKDIYTFDDKGKYLSREENTENDIIKIEGSDAQLTLEYGAVQAQDPTDSNNSDLVMKVDGDINGTKVFEHLSSETNVEWSQLKTGENSSGENYVSTSHKKYSEGAFQSVLGKISNLREYNHSHPSGNAFPSGINAPDNGDGDVPVAKTIEKRFPNAKLNIYNPHNNEYIKYSSKSKESDYPQLDNKRIETIKSQILRPAR